MYYVRDSTGNEVDQVLEKDGIMNIGWAEVANI